MYMGEEALTLTELGLTERQARILLILTRLRTSTARSIARASQLPRQDVYKVLDELQQLSFVQKKICSPTEFMAISIQDVCTELLSRRVEKTSDLIARTKTLTNNFKQTDFNQNSGEESGILLVPEKQAYIKRLKKSVEIVQENIDVITPRKFLNQGLFSLAEELNDAMKRGVQIRIITNGLDPLSEQTFPNDFIRKPGFSVKTIEGHPCLRFCVYDKKEVSVVLSLQGDFAKSSLLWSNSVSLVNIFQDHFDILWQGAKCPHFIKPKKRKTTKPKQLVLNEKIV